MIKNLKSRLYTDNVNARSTATGYFLLYVATLVTNEPKTDRDVRIGRQEMNKINSCSVLV